jgi:putative acetyltransferase
MIVRQELPDDAAEVRGVVVAAFTRDDGAEPTEARLLDELRGCAGWIPELSLVAVVDGRVVGHAVCTRGFVAEVPCLGLGPIGVAPRTQRSGVGSALMHTMLGCATGMGERLIALLGSPVYYSRFGFGPSTEFGVEPPDPNWGDHFQVRLLQTADPGVRGGFAYADPFGALSAGRR